MNKERGQQNSLATRKTASAAEMIVGVNKHGSWSQLTYVGQIRFEHASN